MTKDIKLKAAKKSLINLGFNVEYQSDKSLVVYYGEDNVPFLFIIHDTDEFPGLILNVAIDYFNTLEMAEITVDLMHVARVAVGEQFYFNKAGILTTGEHAVLAFEAENVPNSLINMETKSKEFH